MDSLLARDMQDAFQPPESRDFLEKAFAMFDLAGSREGSMLSCAAVIDSHLYGWNDIGQAMPWVARMERLIDRYGDIPGEMEIHVTRSMTEALAYCCPDHSRIEPWADRMEGMIRMSVPDGNSKMKCGLSLTMYYIWIGNGGIISMMMQELESIARQPDIAPIYRITVHLFEAVVDWTSARFETYGKAVESGLQMAEDSGIHIFDSKLYAQGVYGALLCGDMEAASQYLGKMEAATNQANTGDVAHYHYVASFHTLCKGDFRLAAEYARITLDLSEKTGFVFPAAVSHLILAYALFLNGVFLEEVKPHVEAAFEIASRMKSLYLEFSCHLLDALIHFRHESEIPGAESLKRALCIGKKYGIMNFDRWRRQDIGFVCGKALESGIETEFVQGIVMRFGLVPEAPMANWPYPVRIYAGETFRIVVDGKPLEFSGKVQKKPLEMLTVIIGHGAKGVAEERICDELWPDAEGDRAHQSFTTTLKRLRQLLGHPEAIALKAGRVTLDPRYCRVDALSATPQA